MPFTVCPRCGGCLVLESETDDWCLYCGYRLYKPGAKRRPVKLGRPRKHKRRNSETVLFRHELGNLRHLKSIARGEL